MFQFIKNKLQKIYATVTAKLAPLFATPHPIDVAWLTDLRQILLHADTGPALTKKVISHLTDAMKKAPLSGEEAHAVLATFLESCFVHRTEEKDPRILLIVGVNGSGKTTFISKLAQKQKLAGKRTLIIAGDTFRAAATEQLAVWAKHIGVDIHIGKESQDPASVIFDGCNRFAHESYDHLIIDTAGRLQTKTNLMNELSKIKRTITKKIGESEVATWLVLDSMLGQNAIAQAEQFHEATTLTGLVLTKCDGTGKGGFVLTISDRFKLPLFYLTFGEELDALKPFDPHTFVAELLEK